MVRTKAENEAETVLVFYFRFISPYATGFTNDVHFITHSHTFSTDNRGILPCIMHGLSRRDTSGWWRTSLSLILLTTAFCP